jgi:hypothetical protein
MWWDGLEKLIAAAGAAIAAALTPIGVIYTASINRKTKVSEASLSALTTEVKRLEARLKEVELEARTEKTSGLRWYQLVLFWFQTAHDMRRAALDARQLAESLARQGQQPQPAWPGPLHLPLMEDPAPLNQGRSAA